MKPFYFLLAALMLSLRALAQFPVPGEETPYGHSVDSMLQYVDKSRISSGILYDRVLPLAMLPYFDRFRADTTSVDHLRQAYLEL